MVRPASSSAWRPADGEVPFAIAEGLAKRLRAAGYDAELTTIEEGAHMANDDLVVAKVLEVLGG